MAKSDKNERRKDTRNGYARAKNGYQKRPTRWTLYIFGPSGNPLHYQNTRPTDSLASFIPAVRFGRK